MKRTYLDRHPGGAVRVARLQRCFARLTRGRQDDFFGSSPGPLTHSHGALDNPDHCNDCHVNGTKDLSNDKCLTCHDHQKLAGNIAAGKGFHASPNVVRGKKCESCHHEHKGKSYDLMGWSSLQGGEKGFDHELTGWPLNGAHQKTACADCHKARDKQGLKKLHGHRSACAAPATAEGSEPHHFDLSVRRTMLACERCHTETVWKPAKGTSMNFNHDDRKDARMPLLGSHHAVACAKCHTAKSVFHLPFPKPDACGNAGCHASEHDGHLFGKRKTAEWCHSPTFKTLKQQNFDHTAKTRFDLGPAHGKIKCYDCHTKALGRDQADRRAGEASSATPSGTTTTAIASRSSARRRRCGMCHPSGGPKFTPSRVQPRQAHQVPADRQARERVGCRAVPPRQRAGRLRGLQRLHRVHGLPRAQEGPRRRETPQRQVEEHPVPPLPRRRRASRSSTPSSSTSTTGRTRTSRSSRSTRACRAATATAAALRSTRRRSARRTRSAAIAATRTRCTRARSATSARPATRPAAGTRSTTTRRPDGGGFELKGEHLKTQVRGLPHRQRASSRTRRRRPARRRSCPQGRRRPQGPARRQVCERCHLETGDNTFNHNTMSAFQPRRQAPRRCAARTVTRRSRSSRGRPNCFGCHPEPKRAQGPVRHRLRAVPHDAHVGGHQAAPRRR